MVDDKTHTAGAAGGPIVLEVKVENLAPANGSILTAAWFGFHDGSFDVHDSGRTASEVLERLSEEGNPVPVMEAFDASGAGAAQGVVGGPFASSTDFGPGDSGTYLVLVDPSDPRSHYFSYGWMFLPSNDAFNQNDDPRAHRVVDAAGGFVGADFVLTGEDVRDAGTELNDEAPMNAASFGQVLADMGVPTDGVVADHPGHRPASEGGILAQPEFANADFDSADYEVARVTVREAMGATAGTAGADALYGTGDADTILTAAGDDTVRAGGGDDRVFLGTGADEACGGGGGDLIAGGEGDDALHGDSGDDTLFGEFGDDELHGGYGNDLLQGDFGGDTLRGGAGNDTLWGGFGDDLLVGGEGADVFAVPIALAGSDVVHDFTAEDRIMITGFEVVGYDSPVRRVSQAGADTVIQLSGNSGDITLRGFSASGLPSDWLIIA